MRRRLSRLFKRSGSSSSCHDESSTRSSADVLMEDAEAPRRLLNDTDLDLVSDRERQAYYMLSDREYAHTREYSPKLLKKIGYHLYNCRELTIPLQTIEESRAGGAYRETHDMTRNERESLSSSTPVQMYEAGWEPTEDAPGWTQAPRHSIGVSTWASASEDWWRAPHDIQWGDNQPSRSSGVPPSPSERHSSSSHWDLGEITKRMDTLDMQTGEIQYNLTEHIAQTQE
ncbi:hypothetical protein [Oryza sativa Japonica Group]|uniref:Uncharacterized protein P0415C01.24 n=1 Tax=Oryza sativa subsp. japonica TaxID=39947 RepID=Q5ZC80_ORYSJ|nr:hypothetical protein [Oryza sativa Japonica Group]